MTSVDELHATLTRRFDGRLYRDEPIGPFTTYRVGGAASLMVIVETDAELAAVAAATAAAGVATLTIGKGSNLLVCDAGFPGLALRLGNAFASIDIAGAVGDTTLVRAGGAASLPVVARRTAAAALTGFEWAVGVPGSIGGAVRMNAGGHGSDMSAVLARIRVVDLATGEDGVVPVDTLDLGYRSSAIRSDHVVGWAELALRPGDRERSEAEIREIVRWRRANQPGGQNAGSVFANPPGDSAGRLIEAAGCKGLRVGTAAVSPKHANFIQADPSGRADDVYALMVEVRQRVHAATGVVLHNENLLIGYPPLPEVEGS